MVQSVCTFSLSASFVFTPEMGFRKIEIQSGTDTDVVAFKLTGSIPLNLPTGEVLPSKSIQLRTPFILQSLGNTPLGDITIDPNATLTIIGYQ